MLSSLAHSSLEVYCSYRLKFFVAKNHLRSSSLSNCSLLGSRFARSCSTRPSQRSKYTEGVVLRMRICIAVQRLSRKCVQKKNTPESVNPGLEIERRSIAMYSFYVAYIHRITSLVRSLYAGRACPRPP